MVETVSRLRGERLEKWRALMAEAGLVADEIPARIALAYEGDELVASGGRDGNILKMLAVSDSHRGEDLLSTVLTELRRDAFEDGYSHLFLYTKPSNKLVFQSLFFYPVAETEKVLVMENKRDGLASFLDKLPPKQTEGVNGALVMNCNPFTLGHQYLVETAAAACDRVYLFVLSERGEGFDPALRLELVKAGTAHLPNVTVLETGPYMISAATFPTYFLKDRESADRVMCEVDIEVFLKHFVPRLGITKRFVGTEPLSPMTNTYNTALKTLLPQNGVQLVEIPRRELNGTPISASLVRRLIKEGSYEQVKALVPPTTFEAIKNNK